MANDIESARRRLAKAIAAERAAQAAPAYARVMLLADVAPDDEVPDAAEPPVEEREEETDQAARELAEKQRAANDANLEKIGRRALWVVGGAAVAAAVRSYVRACDVAGGPCGFPRTGVDRAAVLTPLVALAILGGLSLLLRKQCGIRGYFLGEDGRYSTSATQVLVWTAAIAYSLLFLAIAYGVGPAPNPPPAGAPAISAPGGTDPAPKRPSPFDEIDVAYFLLLGGPFAAAGLARASVTRKTEEGTLQKTSATAAKTTDIVTDDAGNPSVVDLQYLLFNLVALAYFVGQFWNDPTKLPHMPLELVGLTSLAALTYTGNKIAERNAPVVASVTRVGSGPVRPGDRVVISGANFVPAGTGDVEGLALRVRFGAREVRVLSTEDTPVTRDRIEVTVPADVKGPSVEVTVVTATGLESTAYVLEVVDDKPVVTGVAPQPVRPGEVVRITGRFFTRPGFRDKPSVAFDGRPARGVGVYDDKHITVTVPPLTGDTTQITVRAAAGVVDSEAVTVSVEPAPPPRGKR